MFKNLKSLFITEDEAEQINDAESTKNTEKPTVNIQTGNQQENAPNKTSIDIDKSIINKLLKALEDNNQAGFDYFEYKTSLKALEKFPMDEATKYQSAFATAATMSVTLDKLLSSIEFYKKVLKVEEENFMKASKEQYVVNVENRLAEREKLEALIKEKSSKIQQLTSEIRDHQKMQDELTSFISTSENKIKLTESNFHSVLSGLISQIEEDAIKLKQYIK